MRTAEILQTSAGKPLHARSDEELRGLSVSSRSMWHSEKWVLDNPSHGQKLSASAINWSVKLTDGSLLVDPAHAQLLDWLRRVVWALYAAPGDGFMPLAPGSAGLLSMSLRQVVPWLVDNAIRWPHELTQEVLDTYLDELPRRIAADQSGEVEEKDDGRPTYTAAYNAIKLFFCIWRQRQCLEEAGIKPMPTRPWPEVKGVRTLAKQVSQETPGWIQPLPDEVAIPLLNRAVWFLGAPARDILALQATLDRSYRETSSESIGKSIPARATRQRRAAQRFQFSTVTGESAPWHSCLRDFDGKEGRPTAVRRARQLVVHLQAACCLVLQSFTGMRVSELCGLRSGVDGRGFPADVEMRTSPTGLNEEFILKSEVSKGNRSPRDMPWLLGSRRVGDNDLPLTVHAIQILDQLLAPYRSIAGSDRLLISIVPQQGLPKTTKGVARATAGRILRLYSSFFSDWLDLSTLPDTSRRATTARDLVRWRDEKGASPTTHQLRKTYAAYVLSVHPELLPAVKRQFHHVNMAITEGNYWGASSPQIDPVKSVSRQLTAQMLFEAVQGRSKMAGRMGQRIQGNMDQLRKEISGLTSDSAWVRVSRWVDSNDLLASHAPHGACIPLIASRMECWKRSGLRPLQTLNPNYLTRDASLCAGCACYAMDERHVPFWRDRYVQHEVSLRLARRVHRRPPNYRIIASRADQARKILADVGEDVDSLEKLIEEEITKHG